MRKHAYFIGAAAVAVLLFFVLPPLSQSGLWDPYEVTTADLARRIAVHLLGAPLTLDGANNALPTLGDLGRPQLPFTFVALGLRVFGLHDWAGRAPFAAWGVLGVIATYAWVARLEGRRAGLYAAVVLATMPLYFVQARTMLGDIVTMGASTMAFGGLAVSAFGAPSGRARLGWLALAAIGLSAGFAARGALLGVAVPTLGVGLAALLDRERRGFGRAVAAGSLALGGLAVVATIAAMVRTPPGEVSMVVGALVRPPAHRPPFDRVLAMLGHALLPWSAFVPFAIGRLFAPAPGASADRGGPRAAIVIGAALAFGAHAWLATRADLVVYSAPALLAVACALALRDFERGAHPSIAIAVGTVVLAFVLRHDLQAIPQKVYEPFGIGDGALSTAFAERGAIAWTIAIAVFSGASFLAWLEPDGARVPFDRARYVAIAQALRGAWDGWLATLYGAVVAALVGTGAIVWVSLRMHARWVAAVPASVRSVALDAWWVVALAPIVTLVVVALALDALQWLTGRLAPMRVRRGALVVVAGAVAGLVLCGGYYPALAAQLSPKGAFARYERVRAAGEPIGLLGVGIGAAPYAGARDLSAPVLRDPAAAATWLGSSDRGRRFVATTGAELAPLNHFFRALTHRNVPVLDATSDRSLLAVSALAAGEASQSPLDAIVLSSEPRPRHRLDANLNDQLTVLGFDLVSASGAPIEVLRPGRPATIRTYYRVVAPVTTEWTIFVHIDGQGRRHNGDHPVTAGRYPMTLWLPGDIVLDEQSIVLEPSFTPGTYALFFGLYSGSTRLAVKGGPGDAENRIHGGPLPVE